VESTSDITVSDDGSAEFHVHIKMPVEASQDMRKGWDASSDSSKEKFFENLQTSFAQGGKITEHDVKGLDKRYGPLEFDFKYKAAQIYQVANDMLLLREDDPGNVPDFKEDQRHYQVFVPTNSLIINRNTYHLSNGLKINAIPSDYDLSSGFMRAVVKYSKGDGTVTVERDYHLKRATIPPQGFADIKKFREELEQKNQMYIILKRKTSLPPETQNWIQKQ
jgi:hypothetical protein